MNRKSATLPRARQGEELVVEQLQDETLIYDRERDKAHCLNRAAGLVWRHCDGKTTVDELLALLQNEGIQGDDAFVELALDELKAAQLLDGYRPAPSALRLRARRKALKKMAMFGGMAIALPIVESIIAPSVAEACSRLQGQSCVASVQCCPPAKYCKNKICVIR